MENTTAQGANASAQGAGASGDAQGAGTAAGTVTAGDNGQQSTQQSQQSQQTNQQNEQDRRLSAEAADWRTKYRTKEDENTQLKNKLKEYEDKELSETQRLQRDLEAARNSNSPLSEMVIQTRLQLAAHAAGIDPQLAGDLAMANATVKGMLTLDTETKSVGGVDEAIAKLKELYPSLVGASQQAQGNTQQTQTQKVQLLPTNPGGEQGQKYYKESELRDMKRFEQIEREDPRAWQEGRILRGE